MPVMSAFFIGSSSRSSLMESGSFVHPSPLAREWVGERGRSLGARGLAAVPLVPVDGLAQPVLERDPRLPPELAEGPRRVEHPPRLAVGLRGVPDDLAVEPAEPGDERDEVADRDLEPGAEVHGVALLVP